MYNWIKEKKSNGLGIGLLQGVTARTKVKLEPWIPGKAAIQRLLRGMKMVLKLSGMVQVPTETISGKIIIVLLNNNIVEY